MSKYLNQLIEHIDKERKCEPTLKPRRTTTKAGTVKRARSGSNTRKRGTST